MAALPPAVVAFIQWQAQQILALTARVTACLLTESPKATLSIEGFGSIVTSTAAPIATGWSDNCRVGIATTEDRRLFTAHNGDILCAKKLGKLGCDVATSRNLS